MDIRIRLDFFYKSTMYRIYAANCNQNKLGDRLCEIIQQLRQGLQTYPSHNLSAQFLYHQ